MKIALVYDRVNKFGGAERVLLALHELFPDAPLYTTVYNKDSAAWASVFDIRTSFLQNIPFAKNNHELYPFLSSIAFEQFTFDEFDCVISVTSAEAKGIITKPGTVHICYCLTPTRYLWSHFTDYFNSSFFRYIFSPLVSRMKAWDMVASSRPDVYISISHEIQKRIQKYYMQDSNIIYPPVELLASASKIPEKVDVPKPYFLIVSRLVSYKHIDTAIDAFNKSGDNLVIIGKGRMKTQLETKSEKNIYFRSDLTDLELSYYYQNCEGFIMPQEEDFGISGVEAQMYGKGVIAYKKGGVLDTVIDGKTGVFFENQTKHDIQSAVEKFKKQSIRPEDCKNNAKRFLKERFMAEMKKIIENVPSTKL